MTYLLDTVAFLRALDGTLPRKTLRRLNKPGTELLVSILTPWEIVLKRALRYLDMQHARIEQGILDLQARLLPITLAHTRILHTLPQFKEHTDPFDRMLIAQAIEERCPLVSNDTRFELYRKLGLQTLWD